MKPLQSYTDTTDDLRLRVIADLIKRPHDSEPFEALATIYFQQFEGQALLKAITGFTRNVLQVVQSRTTEPRETKAPRGLKRKQSQECTLRRSKRLLLDDTPLKTPRPKRFDDSDTSSLSSLSEPEEGFVKVTIAGAGQARSLLFDSDTSSLTSLDESQDESDTGNAQPYKTPKRNETPSAPEYSPLTPASRRHTNAAALGLRSSIAPPEEALKSMSKRSMSVLSNDPASSRDHTHMDDPLKRSLKHGNGESQQSVRSKPKQRAGSDAQDNHVALASSSHQSPLGYGNGPAPRERRLQARQSTSKQPAAILTASNAEDKHAPLAHSAHQPPLKHVNNSKPQDKRLESRQSTPKRPTIVLAASDARHNHLDSASFGHRLSLEPRNEANPQDKRLRSRQSTLKQSMPVLAASSARGRSILPSHGRPQVDIALASSDQTSLEYAAQAGRLPSGQPTVKRHTSVLAASNARDTPTSPSHGYSQVDVAFASSDRSPFGNDTAQQNPLQPQSTPKQSLVFVSPSKPMIEARDRRANRVTETITFGDILDVVNTDDKHLTAISLRLFTTDQDLTKLLRNAHAQTHAPAAPELKENGLGALSNLIGDPNGSFTMLPRNRYHSLLMRVIIEDLRRKGSPYADRHGGVDGLVRHLVGKQGFSWFMESAAAVTVIGKMFGSGALIMLSAGTSWTALNKVDVAMLREALKRVVKRWPELKRMFRRIGDVRRRDVLPGEWKWKDGMVLEEWLRFGGWKGDAEKAGGNEEARTMSAGTEDARRVSAGVTGISSVRPEQSVQ